MKRSPGYRWLVILLVLALCLAGYFLRQWQLQTELLSDGSLAPGSRLHYWLLAVSLLTVVALALLLYPLKRQRSWRSVFLPHPALCFFQLPAAVGLVVGNVLILLQGRRPTTALAANSPRVSLFLANLTAPLGLLCALCLFLFAIFCLYRKRPSPLLSIACSLYLAARLIVCFQEWNTDPCIHDYCYQLLAAICCMLATFQLGGFSFDRGKRRITLFWMLLAMLFCSITVADSYHKGSPDEILINLSLLISMAGGALQLLFCNEEDEFPEEESKEDEVEAAPAEPTSETE